ncbi:hypothetical protein [Arthrobacter sp. ISL-95]|uniref:hypothetical protein n=1 Tax=Arthrobacter sp. ISL-95 TaxID=2819116 RepID=UPI00257017C9|nr:hypothetical protein [Arthrobacter sp. ISL-95]
MARNINDFSIPELVKTASRDVRSRAARPAFDDVKQKRRPDILPGPTPFLPLSVTPNFRGNPERAAVRGCKATEWSSEEGEVPAELKGHGVEYRMERLPDGTMRVESTAGISGLECSDVTLPLALFEPAPEPSDVTDVVIAERTDIAKTPGVTARIGRAYDGPTPYLSVNVELSEAFTGDEAALLDSVLAQVWSQDEYAPEKGARSTILHRTSRVCPPEPPSHGR